MEWDWEFVRQILPVLIDGVMITILATILGSVLAAIVGLAIALSRRSTNRLVSRSVGFAAEFIRGTPLLVQLYFIFFFLPEVGINVPAFWTAILGLSVNYSAYESEIYRAGLSAVPKGQMEAALALGMSQPLALRRIIVPQAMRIVGSGSFSNCFRVQ